MSLQPSGVPGTAYDERVRGGGRGPGRPHPVRDVLPARTLLQQDLVHHRGLV